MSDEGETLDLDDENLAASIPAEALETQTALEYLSNLANTMQSMQRDGGEPLSVIHFQDNFSSLHTLFVSRLADPDEEGPLS